MQKVVIVGESNLSYSVAELLNPSEMKLVGFGDTREDTWNVFDDEGNIKDQLDDMPVMPVDLVASLGPDLIVMAALGEKSTSKLRYLVIRSGYLNDILFIDELRERFSVAGASLRRVAQRLQKLGVPGAVAELGAYMGDTSWQLNVLFPDRKLYLFDTFSGFDARDTDADLRLGCSDAKPGECSGAKAEKLLERLPHKENAVIKEGWFPETALDMEDEAFALAYIDACLYNPTLSGLEFFIPRMSKGGVIVLCGYNDARFGGVFKAVEDLEAKYGALLMLPLGDLMGTMLIIQP